MPPKLFGDASWEHGCKSDGLKLDAEGLKPSTFHPSIHLMLAETSFLNAGCGIWIGCTKKIITP